MRICEAPLVRPREIRGALARVALVLADGQRRAGGVEIGRRIRERRGGRIGRVIEDELFPLRRHDRRAPGIHRDRERRAHPAVAGR